MRGDSVVGPRRSLLRSWTATTAVVIAWALLPLPGAAAVPTPTPATGRTPAPSAAEPTAAAQPDRASRKKRPGRCPLADLGKRKMSAAADASEPDDGVPGPGARWVAGEVLLRFSREVTPAVRTCVQQHLEAQTLAADLAMDRVYLFKVKPGIGVEQAVSALREAPDVVSWVIPNILLEEQQVFAKKDLSAITDPLIPRFDWTTTADAVKLQSQWHLKSGVTCAQIPDPDPMNPARTDCRYRGIGAIEAWKNQGWVGDPRFRLGVIDTGLEGGTKTDGLDFHGERKRWFGLLEPEPLSNFSGVSATVVRGNTKQPELTMSEAWPGGSEKDGKPVPDDHGTAVASLAAGFGGNGVRGSGVMQRAGIVSVRADSRSMAAFVLAMDWIASPADREWRGARKEDGSPNYATSGGGARVVNMSWGMGGFDPKTDPTTNAIRLGDVEKVMSDAMTDHPDTLWIWAASNDAFDNDTRVGLPASQQEWPIGSTYVPGEGRWKFIPNQKGASLQRWKKRFPTLSSQATDIPCVIDSMKVDKLPFTEYGPFGGTRGNLICVAASDVTGQLADFSNFGRRTVEFAAPGADLLVPQTGDQRAQPYKTASGTSFAAPLVTGVAGLVMSKYPQLDVRSVKCVLMQAAARAPLPDQDLTKPSHPAFLQDGDKLVEGTTMPVTDVTQIDPLEARAKPDALLRVMGIPNAEFAMRIAARTVQEMALGVRINGRQSCAPPNAASSTLTYEDDQVVLSWAAERGEVVGVEVHPSWGKYAQYWVRVPNAVDPGGRTGTLRFPRGNRPSALKPWPRLALDVRLTFADRHRHTIKALPRANPAASRDFWDPKPEQ